LEQIRRFSRKPRWAAGATDNDWFEALELSFVIDTRFDFRPGWRKLVEDSYSVNKNASLLARIFEEVASL